jgi:glycosyltransferase involved in cell wall biosynthesis
MKDNPKISIIIPVFNEKEDIITTINYIKKLNYSNYELIIIDDSTDETPQLIKKNKFEKLIYIQPPVRKDRSQARNIGIKKSTGEILVILNADVLLPDDFLDKIIVNYKNGCDYLLVDSEVYNLSSVYSRHVDCDHKYKRFETNWVNKWTWTEGFSVKKDIALKTSLFPSGSVPMTAGEDRVFGEELDMIGAVKKVDLDIVVKHISQDNFNDFWIFRKSRGAGSSQVKRFVQKWSYSKIFLIELIKFIRNILWILLIIPTIYKSYKFSKYSNQPKVKEFLLFCFTIPLEKIAISIGAFECLGDIIQKEKKFKE